ncbi:ribose 5-phosphate isomerase B [Yoonia maricola]|uniref:Ribose 5-phosphate isomerase B n=1 Tax=Yoonia maricola TaxID=420999 RepID=A0A2M8W157_9RHOB|nr:ribose 5-phosphate isomerase B [Yoonia maricola]PJI84657.1 ribose 5-phosphate isomerase B [Yoonia maricola]
MTNKRIVLSSDHAAIELRQQIVDHVTAKGWEAVDIGPKAGESADYPIQGDAAARRVASGDCTFGIILCGTGQGIMMAANKVKGIRCGVCSDVFSAQMIREHNDANMLAMGARVIDSAKAIELVDAFLDTAFGGGRHAPRVEMIKALEG